MLQGAVTDISYDGKEESGQLSEGLGQLCDGYLGYDGFKPASTGMLNIYIFICKYYNVLYLR